MKRYGNVENARYSNMDELYSRIGVELFKLSDRDDYIAIYAKRDVVNNLFVSMIRDGYDIAYVDFDMADNMLENRIYVMLVRENGAVSIERAHSDSGDVLHHDAKIVLAYREDCDHDVIDYCIESGKDVVLFDFGVGDSYGSSKWKEEYKNYANGNESSSASRVKKERQSEKSSNNMVDEDIKRVSSKLRAYCNYMDEVNEILRFLF